METDTLIIDFDSVAVDDEGWTGDICKSHSRNKQNDGNQTAHTQHFISSKNTSSMTPLHKHPKLLRLYCFQMVFAKYLSGASVRVAPSDQAQVGTIDG